MRLWAGHVRLVDWLKNCLLPVLDTGSKLTAWLYGGKLICWPSPTVLALTPSFFGIWRECRGLPHLGSCAMLCCLPTKLICSIPGISQGIWLECYLLLSGMPGLRLGMSTECFVPEYNRQTLCKIKNGKLSLDNESRHAHTCQRTFSAAEMLSRFSDWSQIQSISPVQQINHSGNHEMIY